MTAEEIIGMMPTPYIKEAFVKNWERYHKVDFSEADRKYKGVSPSEYAIEFISARNSFGWAGTPEGFDLWCSVNRYIILHYVGREVTLIKRAMLQMRREGRRLDLRPAMASSKGTLNIFNLTPEQLCIANCVIEFKHYRSVSDQNFVKYVLKMLDRYYQPRTT